MNDTILYTIALTMVNGVGGVLSRQLLQALGDARAVFQEKKQLLERIPGIGSVLAAEITNPEVLRRAEQEVRFIDDAGITVLVCGDEAYPFRLRECPDAPLVLYYKGKGNLNARHAVSVVGTRHATRYGQEMTAALLDDLAALYPDTLIVSGLAYGIDIAAHRQALAGGLPTVGVLAHGLDRIYPPAHRQTAIAMLEQGGLLTDFPSGTNPDRPNFLKRNRIIAGLTEATLVIESAEKGGSLVTAGLALSYGRDVFACPGRIGDLYSAGCNQLIRRQSAALITSARDLVDALGWQQQDASSAARQTELLFAETDSPEIQRVLEALQAEASSISTSSRCRRGSPSSSSPPFFSNSRWTAVSLPFPATGITCGRSSVGSGSGVRKAFCQLRLTK